MSEQFPGRISPVSPHQDIESEFFESGQQQWQAEAPERERAAVDFKNGIVALLNANLDSRFICISPGNQMRLEEQKIQAKIIELTLSDIDPDNPDSQTAWGAMFNSFDLPVEFFKEQLGKVWRIREFHDPDLSFYSEYIWLTDNLGDEYRVGRDFIGADVLDMDAGEVDLAHRNPSEKPGTKAEYYVTRFRTVDNRERPVPLGRRQKEFYTLTDSGLVVYAKHPELPNPDDYGDNKLAALIFRYDTERALTASCRTPTEIAHHEVDVFAGNLPTHTIYKPSPPIPPVIIGMSPDFR